jgi:inorganic phosphate transporter, PiT family
MIEPTTIIAVIFLVFLALAFDFTNGFHDAANSIATVVATGTLTPFQAVVLAALCNFGAMFLVSLSVAATVGKGIVTPSAVDFYVIAGALLGAITWNMITWKYGLPTSSSHALIGALIGAVVAKAGIQPLIWEGIGKTLAFIVASPCIGFVLGAGLNTVMRNAVPNENSTKQTRVFRWLQIASASFYSLGHGANDAQKTAGIIWLILITAGISTSASPIPDWAVWLSFAAMGLGTLAGGWRIVQTLGFKLTHLTPRGGFTAETGGGIMLFVASSMGVPVSTTHTITGSILGVGASQAEPKVKWKKAQEIVAAWFLTIPAAALLGAAFEALVRSFIG